MIDTGDTSGATRLRAYGPPIALFLVALLLRAGFGLVSVRGNDAASLVYDDERWYWSIAQSYASGMGMVGEFGHRAERMPLYPWFLSLFAGTDGGVAAARAVQWAIGALAASLSCMLARRLVESSAPDVGGAGRWIPVLSGLIVAVDPALVGMASLLLTEAAFVTATVGLWLCAFPLRQRGRGTAGRWLSVTILAAVCVYLREASVLFVAGLLAWVLAVRRDRAGLLGVAGVALGVVVSLAPWAYRNSRVIGEWRWLTTRGGITLYDSVRPGATGASDLAEVKDAPAVRELSETEWNRYFQERAWEAIREDPWRLLALAPVKIGRTWDPLPHAFESGLVKAVFAAWYIPLYVLAIAGVWSIRGARTTVLFLLLPAICVTLLHGVFVGSVRYRVGALPELAILAAYGLVFLRFTMRDRPVRGEHEA